MAQRIASSWASFAADGEPANKYLPEWPSYTNAKRATMIMDTDAHVEFDPRSQFRDLWEEIGAARDTGE